MQSYRHSRPGREPAVRAVAARRNRAILGRVTSTEQALLEALVELERAATAARTGGPRTPLLPVFERIDRLAAELPPEAPSDLRHFLQRKSYEKARLFLAGRGAENARGACGSGGVPDSPRNEPRSHGEPGGPK